MKILTLAEWLFGQQARRMVFEPLVADWAREWQEARQARITIAISGGTALLVAIVSHAIARKVAVSKRTLLTTMSVLAASTAALLLLQIGLNSAQVTIDYPLEMHMWMALPMVLPMAIPLAMLALMMRVRTVAGMTGRGAVLLIVVGGVTAILASGWLTPRMQSDVRDELYEAMYLQATANDRAGRVTYPGTAVRQIQRSTPEERALRRAQFRSDPRYLAAQADRTRPRWNRPTFMIGALAVALSAMGWAIGGLGRTTTGWIVMWWTLAYATLMIVEGRVLYTALGVSQYIGRGPSWLPLAIFTAAAIVIGAFTSRANGLQLTPTVDRRPS